MSDRFRKMLCVSFVPAIVASLWTVAAIGAASNGQRPILRAEPAVVKRAVEAALIGASPDDVANFRKDSEWDAVMS